MPPVSRRARLSASTAGEASRRSRSTPLRHCPRHQPAQTRLDRVDPLRRRREHLRCQPGRLRQPHLGQRRSPVRAPGPEVDGSSPSRSSSTSTPTPARGRTSPTWSRRDARSSGALPEPCRSGRSGPVPDIWPNLLDPWSMANMALSADGGNTPAPRKTADPGAIEAAYERPRVRRRHPDPDDRLAQLPRAGARHAQLATSRSPPASGSWTSTATPRTR
jgi:hypothetical protein